jgi:hypothetical protein
MKLNMDTANDITYKHVKFQYEILRSVGYIKMTIRYNL